VEGRLLGGRYRLIRPLGTGGMGTVYLCEHAVLGRRYALKVLHADRANDPELVERFRQEARAASRIDQENVVDVVDFGHDPGGELYYVMEVLEGRSLAQVMREDGLLPVGRALALLEQVCRALSAAHASGVIHRDVKPDNILIERLPDGTERAKLIDFGISHVPDEGRLTRDGEIIGTPEYMAPEQAAGTEVDQLTDVYATGVLAYELLTGTLPLVGTTAVATLVAHQTQPPARPGTRRTGLPPEVDQLVLRALAKRPSDRFPSMQAMATEVMRARLAYNLASAAEREGWSRPGGGTDSRYGTGRGGTIAIPADALPDESTIAPAERRTVVQRPPGLGRRVALAAGAAAAVAAVLLGITLAALAGRGPPAAAPGAAAPGAVSPQPSAGPGAAGQPAAPQESAGRPDASRTTAPQPSVAGPSVPAPAAAQPSAEAEPAAGPAAKAAATTSKRRRDAQRAAPRPSDDVHDPYAAQPDQLKPAPF
jgi:serine/threonine-protein kinase